MRSAAALLLAALPLPAFAQELPQPISGTPRWVEVVSSGIVPGSGQLLQGQHRGAVYLAAEALLLTRAIARLNEGRRERDRYREIALNVARREFGGTETDTVFEYYDQMGKFLESGPYDADPGAGFQPATDESTFNGAIWALARRTFLQDPDAAVDPSSDAYQRALDFYRRRAIGPGFLWSWRNARLERDVFREGIRNSDAAFRRATSQIGLLLANHIVSLVDAYVTQRLTATRGIGMGLEIAENGDAALAVRLPLRLSWFD